MTEGQKAMSWALRTHALTVYPIMSNETYKVKMVTDGGVKNLTRHKVKLVVKIGNAEHNGTDLYKQDIEMTNKIQDIYLHYYNKRNK